MQRMPIKAILTYGKGITWAQDSAHKIVGVGVGFVIIRQGPTRALAKNI